MSAPAMSAQTTLAAVEAALRADCPLTFEEDAALRHWSTQVGTTGLDDDPLQSVKLHGSLSALADPVRRQAGVRHERDRVAREQKAAEENAARLAERERLWAELYDTDMTRARLYELAAEQPGPVTAALLLKFISRTDRGSAPASFMPELLPEYARLGGF